MTWQALSVRPYPHLLQLPPHLIQLLVLILHARRHVRVHLMPQVITVLSHLGVAAQVEFESNT